MSVLIFFLVLFVLILVHELGHFLVAKKTDMRVDEFGIGFPPRLFGIKKGETDYTFNALPIGGFVKIFGEDGASTPSSPVTTEGSDRRSEASAEAGEGGTRSDLGRAFASKSKLAQAAVLIAGVTMNVLFAWILFVVVLMAGVPTSVDEANATDSARLIVTEVVEESPAALAGIPLGSVITGLSSGVDRDQILYPSSFSAFVEDHGDVSLSVTYVSNDETHTVEVLPASGLDSEDSERALVGVALSLVDTVSMSAPQAVVTATERTGRTLAAITVGLGSLIVDSFLFRADLSSVAGPIGIVGLVGDAAQFGFTTLLTFTAVISLNLAVINMLPFPALDGGRLVMVGIESVIRRPINPVWVGRVNLVGFALLILLMVAVTFSDVAKIL